MLAANEWSLPLADEREILLPFRLMLRRVAVSLSRCDWTGVLSLEQSFVVVALDSIGDWLNEDFHAVVAPTAVGRLKQQGLW
jgi:hypothetical protein